MGRRATEARTAFMKSLPVMAGYMTLGIGFGLVYTSNGLSALGAVVFSVLVFAGSMQYVSVSLLVSAASPVQMVLMTLAVNLRHLFYSISMLGKYKGTGRYKPYLEFALTDETFSIACEGKPKEAADDPDFDTPKYYFLLSLFDQSYWVTGTIIGVTLQSVINLSFAGVDFSMTALFVVTLTDQLLRRKSIPASALGVLATLACLLVFGSSSFLIPSLAIIGVTLSVAVLVNTRKEGEENAA